MNYSATVHDIGSLTLKFISGVLWVVLFVQDVVYECGLQQNTFMKPVDHDQKHVLHRPKQVGIFWQAAVSTSQRINKIESFKTPTIYLILKELFAIGICFSFIGRWLVMPGCRWGHGNSRNHTLPVSMTNMYSILWGKEINWEFCYCWSHRVELIRDNRYNWTYQNTTKYSVMPWDTHAWDGVAHICKI